MTGLTDPQTSSPFVAVSRDFLREFASTAGGSGVSAGTYVLAGAILECAGISLLVPILGLTFGAGRAPAWLENGANAAFAAAGAHTPMRQLSLLLAIFVVLMIVRAVMLARRDVAIAVLQTGFIEARRLRIAEALANANWAYIGRLRHSRITHVMSGDIQRLALGTSSVLRGATASAFILVQLVLAMILAPVLGAAILVLLIAGVAALGPSLRRARMMGGYVADANLFLLNDTAQFLGGLKLAVSQNLQTGFVAQIHRTLTDLAERQIGFSRQHARSQALLSSLSALMAAALLLAGTGWLHVAPAVMLAVLVLVVRMMAPIGQAQQAIQQFAHVMAVYEKIRDLETELAAAARGGTDRGISIALPTGTILFEGVSYRHAETAEDGEKKSTLPDLDLSIAPGEFLAITGPSGSGKTTFADLLVGLYPPQSGRITVGGVVLEGARLNGWRNCLSYVSQDGFLFHDTIRRNLSWADANAGEKDMWQALALAGADGLVRRLEKGLDTIVGERGTLVSGGERQRLALARALLRKPRLLVLDEATGAIDSEGEKEIFSRLRALSATIVLIAHRTENLSLCDRVLDFGSGR